MANTQSGKQFENYIEKTMKEFGFEVRQHDDFIKNPKGIFDYNNDSVNRLLKNVSYQKLKHSNKNKFSGKVEFAINAFLKPSEEFSHIDSDKRSTILLECKNQDSSGSVEDKLPETYINLAYGKTNYYADGAILLLNGEKITGETKEYIRSLGKTLMVGNSNKRIVAIMDTKEFFKWLNEVLEEDKIVSEFEHKSIKNIQYVTKPIFNMV